MDTKIPSSFWSDPANDESDGDVLLATLWIKTNERLDLLGYAEISARVFEFQTRKPFSAFERACQALGKGLVRDGNRYWLRYHVREQFGSGVSLERNNMRKALVRALHLLPSPSLVEEILCEYPELRERDSIAAPEGLTKPQSRAEQSRAEQSRAEKEIGVQGKEDLRVSAPKRSAKAADRPASLADVQAYASELGSGVEEAGAFFDHFEANGWRQGGRTPLRSWQAAFRNWVRRSGLLGKNAVKGGGVTVPFDPNQPNAHTGGVPAAN